MNDKISTEEQSGAVPESEPTPSAHYLVGDKVSKVGGDYRFDGTVVARFPKLSGEVRFVVEDDRGVLHIYSARNLRPAEEPFRRQRGRAAPVPGGDRTGCQGVEVERLEAGAEG